MQELIYPWDSIIQILLVEFGIMPYGTDNHAAQGTYWVLFYEQNFTLLDTSVELILYLIYVRDWIAYSDVFATVTY